MLITDLSVVNDARASGADGAWSFGGLMTALAPNDAPALVKQWLDSFERRQDVNDFPLPPRPAMRARLTRLWMAKDGATTFAAWTPNLANAPFRLLAIVYRPDLGVVDRNGTIRSAGEARFVFTALDLSKVRPLDEASPLPFTVIFEYGLRASDRDGVKAWAERWHRLGGMAFGADYNAALQAITDSFTRRLEPEAAGRLNQLRTNEGLALPWQLREFRFDAAAGRLVNAPLKDTPHQSAHARCTRAVGVHQQASGRRSSEQVPERQRRHSEGEFSLAADADRQQRAAPQFCAAHLQRLPQRGDRQRRRTSVRRSRRSIAASGTSAGGCATNARRCRNS